VRVDFPNLIEQNGEVIAAFKYREHAEWFRGLDKQMPPLSAESSPGRFGWSDFLENVEPITKEELTAKMREAQPLVKKPSLVQEDLNAVMQRVWRRLLKKEADRLVAETQPVESDFIDLCDPNAKLRMSNVNDPMNWDFACNTFTDGELVRLHLRNGIIGFDKLEQPVEPDAIVEAGDAPTPAP